MGKRGSVPRRKWRTEAFEIATKWPHADSSVKESPEGASNRLISPNLHIETDRALTAVKGADEGRRRRRSPWVRSAENKARSHSAGRA